MRILPVLDLQQGQVVRGVAGRRHEYRPIISRLTASCLPADVAEAFRHQFGLTEFYLADLDAIAGAPPALAIYADILARGYSLWVDAGVRESRQAAALAAAGVQSVVLGLETIRGPDSLRAACLELGSERVVFSLDLKDGRPLGGESGWSHDAEAIAAQAIKEGIRRILVLDLARVGVGSGTGTSELCARLAAAYPQVELAAGGGVSGPADLERLRQCGVQVVLVASALHDGRLQRVDMDRVLGHR